MELRPTIIERAFELARESGSVEEVRVKLRHEGYFQVSAHLSGRQIRGELVQRLDPRLVQPKHPTQAD